MRKTLPLALLGFSALLTGCEDGPDQIFHPFEGDPKPQNGFQEDPSIFVQDGEKGFDEVGRDDVGRAKLCDESELTNLIQEMVVQPIIPDVSIGGIPMWAPDGGPLLADDLIGRPEDGKFCNPPGVYLDAFTWGPTDEVIVFFDPETRLVDGLVAYQQYLGSMEGGFTDDTGAEIPVLVKPRERLTIDGKELDRYASRSEAPNLPNSWLNPVNVTKLYRMIRETYFGAEDFPEDFDCVAEQLCDLIYTASNESVPQETVLALQDSGVQILFTPDGYVDYVYLLPVRSAPFENGADISFSSGGGNQMDFVYQSQLRQDCSLDLDSGLTWADFQTRCIASGDERALERATYNVDPSRDAVSVEFNGVDLHFLRNTRSSPVLRDGERPQDQDVLYSVGFTRTLPAPVQEFRPLTLGNLYKERLEARLAQSVRGVDCASNPAGHPFCRFDVNVPFTSDEPQRIGELLTDDGDSWIPMVIADVEATYQTLTSTQKAALDPRVLDHVYLIEPFVDAVLYSFSGGESELPDAFKAFRTTDDRRWSIGYLSFTRNDVRYRLQAQYSLNFGAVTYVQVERGESEIDKLIQIAHDRLNNGKPYFEIGDALRDTVVSLGGDRITVDGFDRQLETVTLVIPETVGDDFVLEVSGEPIEDLAGYERQIRGERFEFIPANRLNLFGKETYLVIWIREDGTIGKVEQRLFKGELELCPGLPIRYGDNVRDELRAWEATVSPNAYRDCEIVFNYSPNGNVLDSITSISNHRSFVVVDGRAVTASVWE